METALTAPISNPAGGLVLRGPAGRDFPQWSPKATATPQQVKLIRAATASLENAAVRELKDDMLDQLILKGIGEAKFLMGYNGLLSKTADLNTMATAVGNMLRRRHRFLREQEVPLVFRMGAEGEFEQPKDNFLGLSLPMFTAWFNRYATTTRAQALLNAQAAEADGPPRSVLPPTHPVVLRAYAHQIIAGVHKVAAVGRYEDFDQGNVLYDTLKVLGLFDALYSKEQKWEMWNEEATRVKDNLRGLAKDKIIENFTSALAELGRPPDRDPITHATIRACQKRTMKEWVMECVVNETDVGNLLMHLVETQPWQPPELPPEP